MDRHLPYHLSCKFRLDGLITIVNHKSEEASLSQHAPHCSAANVAGVMMWQPIQLWCVALFIT